MRRGTTPTHTFSVDVDLTAAEVIYLTYKQTGKVLVEKTKDDLTITEDQVEVKLTQEETLSFREIGDVDIQFRARFPDGTAIASNIMTADADKILKDGEI